MKKQVKSEVQQRPQIDWDKNLLTFAETRMIEMMDSNQYKEVDEDYTFEPVFVNTTTGETRPSYSKIDKVHSEVVEASKVATKGEFHGVKISFTVLKKRQKTPTIINAIVVFQTEDMEVNEAPEVKEEQLSMF